MTLDLPVGCCLCVCGLAMWRRRQPAPSVLLAAAGWLWFLGGFLGAAVFAHRGPLIHLLTCYPRGRPRDRVERATVAVGYLDALVYPIGRNEAATIVLAVVVVAVTTRGYRAAQGGLRRARLTALVVSAAVLGVLAAGAVARLAGRYVDHEVLVVYEFTLIAASVVIFADARGGRWDRSAITALAIDLGHGPSGVSLRDRIAGALGDPTLSLSYVDAGGDDPIGEDGRARTPVLDAGHPVALLQHDPGVLDDPVLRGSVVALTRIALANARLQADVRERVLEVEASRRRLVSAADAERARLETELQSRVQTRLERVTVLLADLPGDAALATEAALSRDAISAFARGLHPRVLTESGLAAAIADLAAAAPVPVTVEVLDRRLDPDVETAAYFVCAEALTNIAKYAHAAHARISVRGGPGELVVEISDDGVGGADPSRGSGLTGLSDRLDVVGGTLAVDSPAGAGTRLIARIPLTGST